MRFASEKMCVEHRCLSVRPVLRGYTSARSLCRAAVRLSWSNFLPEPNFIRMALILLTARDALSRGNEISK